MRTITLEQWLSEGKQLFGDSGGLLDIRPIEVVMPDGERIRTFDFAREVRS